MRLMPLHREGHRRNTLAMRQVSNRAARLQGLVWPSRCVMSEITYFVALPFDLVDGGLAAGEPIKCPNPAAAIQSAQGLWKIFGHAGAVALSRTSDFEIGKFNHAHV